MPADFRNVRQPNHLSDKGGWGTLSIEVRFRYLRDRGSTISAELVRDRPWQFSCGRRNCVCRVCMPNTGFTARLVNEIVCRDMKRHRCVADQQHQQQSNTVLAIDRHTHHDYNIKQASQFALLGFGKARRALHLAPFRRLSAQPADKSADPPNQCYLPVAEILENCHTE